MIGVLEGKWRRWLVLGWGVKWFNAKDKSDRKKVLDSLGSIIRIMYGGNGSYKSTRLLFIRPQWYSSRPSIYYINFTGDLCVLGETPAAIVFFLSFSFLFCPLPTADCIFSVMINKFAGSHGGGGGKSDTGKSAELFCVCVCALIRFLCS